MVEEVAEDDEAPGAGGGEGVMEAGEVAFVGAGGDGEAALLHGLGFAEVEIGGQEGLLLGEPRGSVAPQNDMLLGDFAGHLVN